VSLTENKILTIEGRGIPLEGNDIDTDQVVPARFLKEITFKNMGDYLFYDARFEEDGSLKEHPLNETKFKEGKILFVQENFGCGSSREHAAQAIKRYGIEAVVGISFSEIFAGNCKSLGIPIIQLDKSQISEILGAVNEFPTIICALNIKNGTLSVGAREFSFSMTPALKASLVGGTWDALTLLQNNEKKTNNLESLLPY
jgi:3-isopropylmalate/(R)-2-methylmalate dehydratase small subunit